ncbi:sulfurtransferase [Paenibacillus tarimensis]
MERVVPMRWLLARMYEPDVVIVDCRFSLQDSSQGRLLYEKSHIPGAIYLDLEKDLSGPVGTHGGRHPLPDTGALAKRLGEQGIDRTTRVVAYDDQGGAMASRLCWLLVYMGHSLCYVMEQGFTAWSNSGYPVTSDPSPVPIPKRYEPDVQENMLADVEDVRRALAESAAVLVDSREPRRYAGLEEPIDRKAGHIPGAVNYMWKDIQDADGKWLAADKLQERFADLPKDGEIIVYCGSGVTACPNVLALEAAGFRNVRLYAGSWSDWITYEENPIVTGEE